MKHSRGLIIIGLVLVCLFSGAMSVGSYIGKKRAESNYETLRQAVSITVPTTEVITETEPLKTSVENGSLPTEEQTTVQYQISAGLAELMEVNEAVVGWITIDGTRIDYPVMQNEVDNEYYLHRDMNGKESYPGSIYIDSNHDINATGLHVIYGHNMKNGTMFKDVTKFTDALFLKSHQSVTIYTDEKEIQLRPVYCYAGPADGSYRRDFSSTEELNNFLYEKTGQEITGNIFVLITCSYGADDERTYCILREDV